MEKSEFKGWQRILLLILPYLIVVGTFQFTGALVSGQDLTTERLYETTGQKVIVSAFGFVGLLLLIYTFMEYVDKKPFLDLGLYFRNHHFLDIIYGVSAGLLVMVIGYFSLSFSGQLEFIEVNFIGYEFLLTIVLYLIVAFSEEILLRGYVLRNFMESMNKKVALLLSAALFSLMHSANPNISWISYVDLFLAGIIIGLPYIYTKNLCFPIAFHFSWNFFQSLFGFNVSGLDSYSLIEFSMSDGNIFNGGDFGFEGSLLSILFQIPLIFILYLIYRKQKNVNDKSPMITSGGKVY